jgi:hypothetical protein
MHLASLPSTTGRAQKSEDRRVELKNKQSKVAPPLSFAPCPKR